MIAYKKVATWLRSTRISILSLTTLNILLLSLFVVQSCKKEFQVGEKNPNLTAVDRSADLAFIKDGLAANPATLAYIAELGELHYECASVFEATGQFTWAQVPIIAPGASSIRNILEVVKFSDGSIKYKIHSKLFYQIQSNSGHFPLATGYFDEMLKKFTQLERQCGLTPGGASDRLLELIYLVLENGEVWIYDPNTGAIYNQGGGGGSGCTWSAMHVVTIYQGGNPIWVQPYNPGSTTPPGGWGWQALFQNTYGEGFTLSFPPVSGGGSGGTNIEPGSGNTNVAYEDVHIIRKAQAIIRETYGLDLDMNTLIQLFGLDCLLELGSRNLPTGQYYAESDCVEEVLANNPFICLSAMASDFSDEYHIDLSTEYALIALGCNNNCYYEAFKNCVIDGILNDFLLDNPEISLTNAEKAWLKSNFGSFLNLKNYLHSNGSSSLAQNTVDLQIQMLVSLPDFFAKSKDADYPKIGTDKWAETLEYDPIEEYKKLTPEEKELVKAHPLAALHLRNNKSIAYEKTAILFGSNGVNDKSDAFRHVFFLAINAKAVGPDLARQFGIAHESQVPTSLQLEKQMDLNNNEEGIGLVQLVDGYPYTGLATTIMLELNAGFYKYLKPLNWTASPKWPNGNNGITSATQLVPTNQ